MAEALRDIVVSYVCRDRAEGLWQFVMRCKPACRPRRKAVRGCMLMTRGNLAARHRDCARLVDQSSRKGWQKLDGPQRGHVHPGSIWQDVVGARPSSRERTWPLSFPGWRIPAGPCRSQNRMGGKMGVKSPKKGQNCGFIRKKTTSLAMAQLLYCHALYPPETREERKVITALRDDRLEMWKEGCDVHLSAKGFVQSDFADNVEDDVGSLPEFQQSNSQL